MNAQNFLNFFWRKGEFAAKTGCFGGEQEKNPAPRARPRHSQTIPLCPLAMLTKGCQIALLARDPNNPYAYVRLRPRFARTSAQFLRGIDKK